MNRQEVIDYLKRCSGGELSAILNDALPERDEARDEHGLVQRLVLCMASRLEAFGSKYDDGWAFEVVADHPPESEASPVSTAELVEQGTCETCGAEVVAHAKRAQCPLGGTLVRCT